MRGDNTFFLIVSPTCTKCEPYKEKLISWGLKFNAVDGTSREGKIFCSKHKIQGAPNLVILEGGRYVGNIPGAIFDRRMLVIELGKKGVKL
jgi:hypothetical protein